MNEKKRRAIIVLGMHRSGTSALAGMLGLLGAQLPARILPAGRGNPKGHFEPQRIVEIHDRILALAGTTWPSWEEIPEAWFLSAPCRSFIDELIAAVREDYAEAPLFMVKDPRMCRLMPLWYRVLNQIDVKPCFAIPFRNPVQVAKSLQGRDGLPLAQGCLMWLRHVLDAERYTRDHPRLFLSYLDVLTKPRAVIDRMRTGLGITWPRHVESILDKIEDFIDPRLNTHVSQEWDIDGMGKFSFWLRQTYESHQALVLSSNNKVAQQQLDSLHAAFAASIVAFTPIFKYRAEQHAADLTALRETLTERQNEIDALGWVLAERDNQITVHGDELAALRERLEERDNKITTLNKTLAERSGELGDIRKALVEKNDQITIFGNKLVERNTRLATLSEAVILRDQSIAKLRGENAAHERSLRQLKDDLRHLEDNNVRLIDAVNGTSRRLTLIEGSTIWQASLPLRRALAVLPMSVRQGGQKVLTAIWWLLTPHRIPTRLRNLRASRDQSPP